MTNEPIFLSGEGLDIAALERIARGAHLVVIAPQARARMDASRALLEQWLKEEKIVYGITTGFGPLVSTLIPPKFQTELQQNLIRSHSANVGPVFSKEETRAAMALRLNAITKGLSAVRWEVAELLQDMLNAGVHPQVPQWGSVGASGDLTPSAHIALAMMGEGKAEYKGEVMPSAQALTRTGLSPVTFVAKEGLALINGTTVMTGVGALSVADVWNLVKTAEVIAVLALEALEASAEPLLREAHEAKPHPGQIETAENLRKMIKGTQLMWDGLVLARIRGHLEEQIKEKKDVVETKIHVQNTYSLRATPQIVGAVRDALRYVEKHITIEMNSANDNPLFFPELGVAYQGANFHGQPVAMPLDMLAIAVTELGILSERRLNKLLDRARNHGLPPFLIHTGKPGLRCGFEGAQYIATALVAECRTLCVPASIQSIPSNEENQDVVSMGLIAARKARDLAEKVTYILAVELLAACEAMESRNKEYMGDVSKAVYAAVRERVPMYDEDRVMSEGIEAVKEMIQTRAVTDVAERVLGEKLS